MSNVRCLFLALFIFACTFYLSAVVREPTIKHPISAFCVGAFGGLFAMYREETQ